MPQDVNTTDGSSPEEQRKESVSHTEDDSDLDGSLQTLAEKPGVSDIVDRLMNPGGDEADDSNDDAELENHNEDEEGKEADKEKSESEDGDEKPAEGETDDKEVDKTAAKKPAALKAATDEPGDGEQEQETEKEAEVEPVTETADDNEPDDQYGNGANKRIRQLVDKRKALEAEIATRDARISELEEKASYRDTLEKTLTEHKVDTKTWDEWTQLGLLMQKNPRRAAQILGTMAKELGFIGDNDPVEVKDADLVEMVKSQDMTEDAAKKIQRQRLITAPAPMPMRETRTETTPADQNRLPSLPRLTRDESAVGTRAIQAVDAEFRKKYPDQWGKIVTEVQTEMAKWKGAAPSLWGKIARDCAEKVVAKRLAKAPVSSRPDPSMRATGGSSRTVTRNNAGPAKSKNELADRIAAGTSGKGPIRR